MWLCGVSGCVAEVVRQRLQSTLTVPVDRHAPCIVLFRKAAAGHCHQPSFPLLDALVWLCQQRRWTAIATAQSSCHCFCCCHSSSSSSSSSFLLSVITTKSFIIAAVIVFITIFVVIISEQFICMVVIDSLLLSLHQEREGGRGCKSVTRATQVKSRIRQPRFGAVLVLCVPLFIVACTVVSTVCCCWLCQL